MPITFNISNYFPITDPTWAFFVVLMIILCAPIIMGKLRIPHIVGMVLAGVAIGKYKDLIVYGCGNATSTGFYYFNTTTHKGWGPVIKTVGNPSSIFFTKD